MQYATSEESKAILDKGSAVKENRLLKKDMMSLADTAKLLKTQQENVIERIKKLELVAIIHRDEYYLPEFQFIPSVYKNIPKIFKNLNTTDGWTVLCFMESAFPVLDMLTPIEAITTSSIDIQKILILAIYQAH